MRTAIASYVFALHEFAHIGATGDLLCASIKQWCIVIGEQREVNEGKRLHRRVILKLLDLDERRIIIMRIEPWQERQTGKRILIIKDPLFNLIAFVWCVVDCTGH